MRVEKSSEHETMRVLSGEKAASLTAFVWPVSTRTSWPLWASHKRTVPSSEDERISVPS
jgi:hypothetical protein